MAKKEARQEALRKGIEQLRGRGVEAEAVSAASVPSLAGHLGKDHDTDLAVTFLLGRVADAASLDALISLEQSAKDKEIKREVRRSLFKLAQKGLSRPEPAPADTPAPKALFKTAPEIEAYMSSVDGAGGRLVWLARPQAGSGLQLLQGMVGDRHGLLRVGGMVVRRKELRRMAQEIKEKHGVTMISVPWDYADMILYEGYEKARLSGQSGIEQFSSLRAIFNPIKPKPSRHPIFDRLDAADARSGDWRERSRRLLDEPEFRYWILDEDWIRPYLEQIEEAQGSRLVLNQVQKEERFAGIVRDAAREIFSGARGEILQRRMEDMALYLCETKREELAKLAFAVALQLAEGDLGILDVSFLTGLMQKSLAFYLGQAKEKAGEEPSLIVKP